jgi:hypothetical protein
MSVKTAPFVDLFAVSQHLRGRRIGVANLSIPDYKELILEQRAEIENVINLFH